MAATNVTPKFMSYGDVISIILPHTSTPTAVLSAATSGDCSSGAYNSKYALPCMSGTDFTASNIPNLSPLVAGKPTLDTLGYFVIGASKGTRLRTQSSHNYITSGDAITLMDLGSFLLSSNSLGPSSIEYMCAFPEITKPSEAASSVVNTVMVGNTSIGCPNNNFVITLAPSAGTSQGIGDPIPYMTPSGVTGTSPTLVSLYFLGDIPSKDVITQPDFFPIVYDTTLQGPGNSYNYLLVPTDGTVPSTASQALVFVYGDKDVNVYNCCNGLSAAGACGSWEVGNTNCKNYVSTKIIPDYDNIVSVIAGVKSGAVQYSAISPFVPTFVPGASSAPGNPPNTSITGNVVALVFIFILLILVIFAVIAFLVWYGWKSKKKNAPARATTASVTNEHGHDSDMNSSTESTPVTTPSM